MTAATQPRPHGTSDRSARRTPYDHDMAKRVLMGIQELRLRIKHVVGLVAGNDEEPGGQHVVFTRHGKHVAALVPMDWYRTAAEKMGEPTEL